MIARPGPESYTPRAMIGANGRGVTIVPLISLAASRGQMRRFSKRVVLESQAESAIAYL